MKNTIFIVDRSDPRNGYVKRLLEEEGYIVLDYGENTFDFTGSTVYVFSPAHKLELNEASALKSGSTVFAGRLGDAVADEFLMRGIRYIDVMDDEIFTWQNALLTAEGTLAVIINETAQSLASTDVLILGYGRVGKAVAKLLSGAGARSVTPAVTNPMQQAMAAVYLPGPVRRMKDLSTYIGAYNVIVNTIPAPVLTAETLAAADCNALIVDLASKPGGTDFAAAEQLHIKAVHALGLPSAAAPQDAGKYLAQRILRALQQD